VHQALMVENRMQYENPFLKIVHWPEVEGSQSSFETVLIKNSDVEFAIFDSCFSPRIPILASSSVSLGASG
jgi:hypothetical protein